MSFVNMLRLLHDHIKADLLTESKSASGQVPSGQELIMTPSVSEPSGNGPDYTQNLTGTLSRPDQTDASMQKSVATG